MELFPDIKLIENCYLVYIKSLKALVIGDLHLGFEGVSAKSGIYLPKVNLKYILEQIEKAAKNIGKNNIKRIIVLGDIKNEFDEVDEDEINELFSFSNYLRTVIFNENLEMILIKGNHDNYVDAYAKAYNFIIYRQEALFNEYLMFHGEEEPREEFYNKAKFLILAHEHPAIGLYTEIGTKIKYKCFLYGKNDNKYILVLPAISYYMQGTEINLLPKEELLSPFLRKIDIDELMPITVENEILIFPKIKYLR